MYKRFFGTTKLPEIEIDDKTINLLAAETTNKGFTVPGVQKKLSLHLVSDDNKPRLTLECGITKTTAEKLIENLVALVPKWLSMCDNSLLPPELKNA